MGAVDISSGNFSIEGSNIKNFGDIQRTFMWEVYFPNMGRKLGFDGDAISDDMTLHAREATIPSRGTDTIESQFGGMRQFFPGKPTFSNDVTLTFEETEEQNVTLFLYAWNQMIFGTSVNKMKELGHSNGVRKRDYYSTDIEVIPFPYGYKKDESKSSKLKYKFIYKNAWLSNVSDVSLSYGDSSSVKYQATFAYDYWELVNTEIENSPIDYKQNSRIGNA
jgi:hypothetical protein